MEHFVSQLLSNLQGIWKYRWLAFGVMWLVALAGWARVATLPDDYQSTARVYVDTQSILKPLMQGMTSLPNVEQQVAIMSRSLLSRPNLERVIRMVDMDLAARTARDHERQIEDLLARIRIGGTSSFDIYSITYNDANPRLARDVVQSLLTIFVEGSFRGKKGESDKAVEFIDEQIKSYEEKLLAAENSVKAFKLAHNTLLPREGVDYSAQILMAGDALKNAQLELAEAEQARQAIAAQASGDELVPPTDGQQPLGPNPEIDGRIDALNKNLDALRMQYTELHPDIVGAKRLIAVLQERKAEEARHRKAEMDPGRNYSPMLQQLKVALAEADARVAAIRARVQEMAARVERLQERANAVPEAETQLAQLNRDYAVNKDNYEKLIARRESAKLTGELSTTTEMMSFKIIDPPTLPLRPMGPNRPLLYSVVLAVALASGCAAAILVSQLRPTFLSPGELREITGLRVLGTVTMNWTDEEKRKQWRDRVAYCTGVACLVLSYSGVMVYTYLQ